MPGLAAMLPDALSHLPDAFCVTVRKTVPLVRRMLNTVAGSKQSAKLLQDMSHRNDDRVITIARQQRKVSPTAEIGVASNYKTTGISL